MRDAVGLSVGVVVLAVFERLFARGADKVVGVVRVAERLGVRRERKEMKSGPLLTIAHARL